MAGHQIPQGHFPQPPQHQFIYCPWCAEVISSAAIKCKHCGEMVYQEPASNRSFVATLLLLLFLGVLGAHAFYAGRIAGGMIRLGCFVAGASLRGYPQGALLILIGGLILLVDLIMLLSRSFSDAEGRTITG